MMTDRFAVNRVKEFYKARCQHQEQKNEMCSGCGQSTFVYRNNQLEEQVEEWQNLEMNREEYLARIAIFDGQEWALVHEDQLEEMNEDNVIAINWGNDYERQGTLEMLGLEVNSSITDLVRNIRQIRN